MNKNTLFVSVLLLLLAGGLVFFISKGKSSPQEVFQDPTFSWKTFTDPVRGISFKYPESLGTNYMEAFDWPPQAAFSTDPFSCLEAGAETTQAGRTEKHTVGGKTYCVTTSSGGAAGSIYSQYAYAIEKNDLPAQAKVAIFIFTIRYPQCGNYEEAERQKCETERAAFDLDTVVDRMAETFQFSPPVSSKGNTGIRGNAKIGPTCPVMRNPPDPQCSDKPYAGSLVVGTIDGTEVVKEFASGADGKFTVEVPPGEYMIHSVLGSRLPICDSDVIVVTANAFADAIVSCDSGIR
jgi:hypothetical protein